MSKKLSVIIPTYNAAGYIDNLLKKLSLQRIDNELEIIVIDSDSTDNTAEICGHHENVRVIGIKNSEFNHGATRNRAAEESSGDILIFMTQDAEPYDDYFLANLIKPLELEEVAAAYGRQIARLDADMIEKLTRNFNYPDKCTLKSKDDLKRLGIKTFFLTNVCSAFKKEVFEESGRFPENIIVNEDMFLAFSIIMSGRKIAYAADAGVLHSHNYSFRQQFKRNFDIGASLRIHGEVLKYAASESEGASFVKHVIRELAKRNKYISIAKFCVQTMFKYAGYLSGLHYKRLPKRMVARCSMNPKYWMSRPKV